MDYVGVTGFLFSGVGLGYGGVCLSHIVRLIGGFAAAVSRRFSAAAMVWFWVCSRVCVGVPGMDTGGAKKSKVPMYEGRGRAIQAGYGFSRNRLKKKKN